MASSCYANKKGGDLNYAAAAVTMTLHGECPIFGHTDCGYPYSMHCTAICCGSAMGSNQRSHHGHGHGRAEADAMVLGGGKRFTILSVPTYVSFWFTDL